LIIRKSPAEIDRIAASGAVLVKTLHLLERQLRPGVGGTSSWPWTATLPDAAPSRPKTARTRSVRPAPMSPAIPKISPSRTAKEVALRRGGSARPIAASTSAPMRRAVRG